ncbi:MAG: hypothetical protein M3014_06860 [Chloroflexota bacterium]|nr:hypothetical protein [Chloroflexota bacterium]
MKSGTVSYTMIDIEYVHGNKAFPESYIISLSRSGDNRVNEHATVSLDSSALVSFIERTQALLRRKEEAV